MIGDVLTSHRRLVHGLGSAGVLGRGADSGGGADAAGWEGGLDYRDAPETVAEKKD